MERSITQFAAKSWILYILLLGVISCGGDIGGAGSGEGANETGIILSVESITPNDTNDVDVVMGTFAGGGCQSTATAGQVEPFTDHNASGTFAAALVVAGASQPPIGKTVTITRYIIEYAPSSGYTGPTIATRELHSQITIAVPGTATQDLALITLDQKSQFLTAMGGTMTTQIPYDVTYTFSGEDEYGREVSAKGFAHIDIANYFHACG